MDVGSCFARFGVTRKAVVVGRAENVLCLSIFVDVRGYPKMFRQRRKRRSTTKLRQLLFLFEPRLPRLQCSRKKGLCQRPSQALDVLMFSVLPLSIRVWLGLWAGVRA